MVLSDLEARTRIGPASERRLILLPGNGSPARGRQNPAIIVTGVIITEYPLHASGMM